MAARHPGEKEIRQREAKGWAGRIGGPRAILGFRLVLAGLFLLSAAGKLWDLERYSVDAVYNFGILPLPLARPFGLALPFLELLGALALLAGIFTRLAGMGLALLSLSFFTAKAVLLAQGREIECGCFGMIVDTLASVTIFFDLPVAAMAWAVTLSPPSSRNCPGFWGKLPSRWKGRLRLVW